MFKDSIGVGNHEAASASADVSNKSTIPLSTQMGLEMVCRANGSPEITLSLVLQRQPTFQDSIRPLVKSGVISFQLKLRQHNAAKKIFAREVLYTISWNKAGSSVLLAKGQSQGTEGRVAFSFRLDQVQSLDALSLLDYRESHFVVKAIISYRLDVAPKRVNIRGVWRDIAIFIQEHCSETNTIDQNALASLIPAMQHLNLLSARDEYANPIVLPSSVLIKIFLRQSAIILNPIIDQQSESIAYSMRNLDYISGDFDYTETTTSNTEKSIEVELSFLDLLEALPTRIVGEQAIFLVAQQDHDPSRTAPVKLNVRAQSSARNIIVETKVSKLSLLNGKLLSLAAATQPVTNPVLSTKPKVGILDKVGEIDKATFLLSFDLFSRKRIKSLPIVYNQGDLFFKDRMVDKKVWFLPKFVIVNPEQNAEPANAPFNFTYRTLGATNLGKPALSGSVQFTLQIVIPEEITKTIEADGLQGNQVELLSLTVSMLVPFVDEVDGKTKQYAFPAAITTSGDKVNAKVDLINDWVRLTYGALSPGFQNDSVQVQINYMFKCFVPVKRSNFDVVFGSKSLKIDVLNANAKKKHASRTSTDEGKPPLIYFDALKLSYAHPITSLQYNVEPREERSKTRGDFVLAHNAIAIKPLYAALPAVIKPVPYVPEKILGALENVKFTENVKAVQVSVPLIFPCNQYGSFYQELINSSAHSFGCQDAFKLGHIKYKEFEELVVLRDAFFLVYRSLVQPGRFVLVPSRFCISRRELGESDAYRPLIFLNALLDPAIPANNKVELRVTMQPDIPTFKIHQITEKLKEYHAEPTIEYPLELPNTALSQNWALDPFILSSTIGATSSTGGPFITTYFSTDLANWQLLKGVLTLPGLSGSITVDLADGNRFSSNLFIKLDVVRGTWLNGPLHISSKKGTTVLINKTEGKIDVSDLLRYEAGNLVETVQVDETLEPGGSCSVTAAPGLFPVYTYTMGDPVAIEEIRSFVEEIYSNFIVVNLLNFANHDLNRIDLEAKVHGLNELHKGTLTEVERVIDFDYILPLTTLLDDFKLDFRITKIYNDKPAETSSWMVWDLNNGPLSITPDLLTI